MRVFALLTIALHQPAALAPVYRIAAMRSQAPDPLEGGKAVKFPYLWFVEWFKRQGEVAG